VAREPGSSRRPVFPNQSRALAKLVSRPTPRAFPTSSPFAFLPCTLMSSPQIPDAPPIEPQICADFCAGDMTIAAAAAAAAAFSLPMIPIVASSSMIAAGLSGPMFVDFLYVAVAMVWISVDYHRRLCLKELPDKLLRRRKEWREIGLLYMCAIVTTLQRCKADWNSASPKSESPKAGTASEFNTGKSNGRRNELIDIESHPCNADFAGAEHGIKEGKAKTSAGWVAATAAPHHATGNRGLLSGFIIEHDDQFVHAVDGIPRKVLARGAVITDSVVLPDVWFVPGLTENLVSISQLVELDHSVGFSCGECCVRSTDGKVVGKGHLQDGGLYVLDFLKVPLAI